jgi:hypothetical protein
VDVAQPYDDMRTRLDGTILPPEINLVRFKGMIQSKAVVGSTATNVLYLLYVVLLCTYCTYYDDLKTQLDSIVMTLTKTQSIRSR